MTSGNNASSSRTSTKSLKRITVFGGSGFLGRQIVRRLTEDGVDVCVAVRQPERASSLSEHRAAGRIEAVQAFYLRLRTGDRALAFGSPAPTDNTPNDDPSRPNGP